MTNNTQTNVRKPGNPKNGALERRAVPRAAKDASPLTAWIAPFPILCASSNILQKKNNDSAQYFRDILMAWYQIMMAYTKRK